MMNIIKNSIKNRAIIIVLDSFGIGALPDADKFNDAGSNTLGHIDEYCQKHNIPFNIPNLLKLGLGKAFTLVNHTSLHCDHLHKDDSNYSDHHCNTNHPNDDHSSDGRCTDAQHDGCNYLLNGNFGACLETSSGKDTTSGHWEIAGYPVTFDWGYFTKKTSSFPQELLDRIVANTTINGYLGNCHASGTEIINLLGEEHIKTGYPIFYTSADSVFQIACHETYFGLENLYILCEKVRELLEPYNIARVIARPFVGAKNGEFRRTGNRHDYSVLPQEKTLLDICKENGGEVIAIGKIGDIYAHLGTTHEIKANGLAELCNATINAIKNDSLLENNLPAKANDHANAEANDDVNVSNNKSNDNNESDYESGAGVNNNPNSRKNINQEEKNPTKTIIFTNLVDFDMLYGHRRDIRGYKEALEYFDTPIPEILANLAENDLLILTADHGCDPTWIGSDHTREYIPLLTYMPQGNCAINYGIRQSFADIGQSVATHLGLPTLKHGSSFL